MTLTTKLDLRAACAAEDGWTTSLIEAAMPQRFVLHSGARVDWEDQICEVRWLHVKLEADRRAIPGAKRWTALKKQSAGIEQALSPFDPGRATDAPLLPAGWLRTRHGAGVLRSRLDDLRRHASKHAALSLRGGRPPVDSAHVLIARRLLPFYEAGFGRAAGKTDGGPTCRFAAKFFEVLQGEWYVSPAEGAEVEVPPGAKRFEVRPVDRRTVRTVVREAIAARHKPWTAAAMVPLFVERFRPVICQKGPRGTA